MAHVALRLAREPQMLRSAVRRCAGASMVTFLLASAWAAPAVAATPAATAYSLILRGGMIYDGSGGPAYIGDVAVRGDRIVRIEKHISGRAAREIDAHGRAVAPGFINMLAHVQQSLLIDGRAQSDLRQGVTLEVMGESSAGPLSPEMKRRLELRLAQLNLPIDWTTLGGYLAKFEHQNISVNIAAFVGANTIRTVVLNEADVQPTPTQLAQMRGLVQQAMEEGALGVTTALIYAPDTYAKTSELTELASESARCGGMYISHMRSEGDRLIEGVQETIDIARSSGAPAEIYHLKAAGRENWSKLTEVVSMVEAARAAGVRITADMYTYIAGASGLDASMPPWVQDGGHEAWVERLKDPPTRARVIADMRDPHPSWENLMRKSGADGTMLLAVKNSALKPLIGKTIAQIAKDRGVSPEDAAIDLVIEDGSRVGVGYFSMSEENVRRQLKLPWVAFASDADAPSLEGIFLTLGYHPRSFGNFARLLGRYVRDEKVISLSEAVRRLTSLPAENLSLADRGRLKPGYFADIVVFDPATVQDHATFERPMQYSTGVQHVLVNGELALENGEPTVARPGRVLRGRAWTGQSGGGGCRAKASDWRWHS
jgi:N-acyl-D-amino-acid deacylase